MSEKIRKKFDEIRDRFGTLQKVFVHEYVLPDELGPLTASCDLGLVFQKNVGANTFYAAPIKLYQYLAAGLPVVGSNFPSVTRILEDPERPVGFGADPEDPQAIAKAINTLFANEKQYLQFHENALWLAENRYRYDKESEALVALYRRLCES
jgi:glycosyltransferase involved in cell wall biosynthesis